MCVKTWLSKSSDLLRASQSEQDLWIPCVCCREELGRGWQHQGRGCQDAEGVWESERLDQGGAALIWDQSVHCPTLMSKELLAYCFSIVLFDDFSLLIMINFVPCEFSRPIFGFVSLLVFIPPWFCCFVLYHIDQINSELSKYCKSKPHQLKCLLSPSRRVIGNFMSV